MRSHRRFLAAAVLAVAPLATAAIAVAQAQQDPLPSSPLPYVAWVDIGPQPPFVGPICLGDSILVRLAGVFPDHCYHLESIGVVETYPPSLQLVVEQACDAYCIQSLKPWHAEVVLPPLPMGDYELAIAVSRNVCPDSSGADTTLGRARFPYTVANCPRRRPCFMEGWVNHGLCDAIVSPGQPATVTFTVASEVALAGLQGAFSLWPQGLRITKIEPVGPAAGMHLTWKPRPDGAEFVMFAEQGAPIIACSLMGDSLGGVAQCPLPVVAITLEQQGDRASQVTHVTAHSLLGSDAQGRGVSRCDILTIVPVEARICAAGGCDINADGRLDIRDIVLLAHCAAGIPDSAGNYYRAPCADSSGVPDCNQDGNRDLEDVLCCARQILLGPPCHDCPPDTSAPHPAPQVGVVAREAHIEGGVVRLPFMVEGLAYVAGALVALDYPEDRYDAIVRFENAQPGWLRLQEIAGGEARVGLVRYETRAVAPEAWRPMVLELTLKPGRTHGGKVTVNRAEFSGAAGERLEASPVLPSVSLGTTASIALSEPRPNPSANGTNVSLTLSVAADAEVQVYDLSGRAVATIHRGALAAGVHELSWNGRRDGGGSLSAGIYFLRATAAGASAMRKLVILGR